MRTKLFAISGIMAAAMTATIAVANWPTLPLALAPVIVDQNKNVTVDFVNAPASEVISWLKKAGVNFVVNSDNVPDRRLTVHIKNQPMDKAIEAIADAMGMTWTKKGNIYTLKGGGFGNWTTFSPDSKAFQDRMKLFGDKEGKEWKLSPEDEKKWELFGEEMGKKFENFDPEMFSQGQAWKFSPEDTKKWEQLGKEMKEKFKDFDPKIYEWKGGDGKAFEWKDGKMKELEKGEIEKLFKDKFKDMPKNFEFKELPEGAFKTFDGKEWKDLQEHMKGLEKFEWKELPEGGKFRKMDEKEMKAFQEMFKSMPKMEWKGMPEGTFKFDDKEWKAFGEKFKENGELFKRLKDMPAVRVGMSDVGKLLDSLTPEQLEKNKSRGYLTPEDLTADQRKMLGDWAANSDFSIVFNKDGKTVTIKGK